jgi:hypothetical protein
VTRRIYKRLKEKEQVLIKTWESFPLNLTGLRKQLTGHFLVCEFNNVDKVTNLYPFCLKYGRIDLSTFMVRSPRFLLSWIIMIEPGFVFNLIKHDEKDEKGMIVSNG